LKECSFCQYANSDDASRCERCGKLLDIVICPDCKKENATGSTICELCGKDLGEIDTDQPEILVVEREKSPDAIDQSQKGDGESTNSENNQNNSQSQQSKKADWGPAIAGFSVAVPVAIIMIVLHSKADTILECSGLSLSIAASLFVGLRKMVFWLNQRS